jgi:hydroxyacylglutathione hydrolase
VIHCLEECRKIRFRGCWNSRKLYDSIKKLFSLDDYVAVLPSHFGKSQCGVGLSSVPISTIGYEKRFIRSVDALSDKQKFIDYMKDQKTMGISDHIRIKNVNKGK